MAVATGSTMSIHRFVRRSFVGWTLSLVALAALLDARAMGHLALATLTPEGEALAAPPLAAVPPAVLTQPPPKNADAILGRNPFDHSTPLRGAAGPQEPAPASAAPAVAPPCEGVRVLVITASTNPEWSFAAFSSVDEPRPVLRRRGGSVGKRIVRFIGWDRVWLEEDGSLCQAGIFTLTQVPVVPKTPVVLVGRSAVPAHIVNGIEKLTVTSYAIDHGVLENILENQQLLVGSARIQPETIDGRVAGARLMFRPGTLLSLLGLESGDRLDTINGFDMSTPEGALQAYARLRTADRFVVKINRVGKDITMDYLIR